MAKKKKTHEDGEESTTNGKMETKLDKFTRIAKKRVPKMLKAIRNVARLAGSNYEFTDEQGEKIIKVLDDECGKLEAAFKREAEVAAAEEFDL